MKISRHPCKASNAFRSTRRPFPQVPSADGADATLSALPLMARLHEAESGRVMEVFGSQPAAQVYTSNFLSNGEAFRILLLTFLLLGIVASSFCSQRIETSDDRSSNPDSSSRCLKDRSVPDAV